MLNSEPQSILDEKQYLDLLGLNTEQDERNFSEVMVDLYETLRIDEIIGMVSFSFRSVLKSVLPELLEKYNRD